MKPIAFLPKVWRQGRNYFSLVGWLLYTAFKGRTWKLAIAVGLSLLGLATQGAAIFVVYWYGRQMEKGGAFSVPLVHIDINLKEQPEWLWVIVIFSTAFFILSATLLYLVAPAGPEHRAGALRGKSRATCLAHQPPSGCSRAAGKLSLYRLRFWRHRHRMLGAAP